ncbi:hypothetical protein phiOC_p190 [Ochrobactrum phage vB_OspM_OC]|nr:hypothetical protein phiOC_p190 [Ochrobactrum phage vB_OspM_OC]
MFIDILLWKMPIATAICIVSLGYSCLSIERDIKRRHREVMGLAGSSWRVPYDIMTRYDEDMRKFFKYVECGDKFVTAEYPYQNPNTLQYETLGTFALFTKNYNKTIYISFDIPTESYTVKTEKVFKGDEYTVYLVDPLIELVNDLLDERS